jgi:hypothetical protein
MNLARVSLAPNQRIQQWTGINAVLYYAPSIFQQLGMSSNTTSLLATGVVGIVMFIATVSRNPQTPSSPLIEIETHSPVTDPGCYLDR